MEQPPVAWLAAFDAAARHCSFTRAADELGVTQGAISQQISKLEHALGATLFLRNGRHIQLTELGETYMRHISGSFSAIRSATEGLFRQSERYRLTIACYSPTFAAYWLMPRMASLYQAFPEIELDIIVDYQLHSGERHRPDIALTYEEPVSAAPGFVPLFREELIAICHPELGEDPQNMTLIQTLGPRPTWHHWFEVAGLKMSPNQRMVSVNSMSDAMTLALNRCGGALISRQFARAAIAKAKLHRIVPDQALAAAYHGVRLVGDGSDAARKLTKWLVDQT